MSVAKHGREDKAVCVKLGPGGLLGAFLVPHLLPFMLPPKDAAMRRQYSRRSSCHGSHFDDTHGKSALRAQPGIT
eukprot:6365888-Amphidinium_carterae.1